MWSHWLTQIRSAMVLLGNTPQSPSTSISWCIPFSLQFNLRSTGYVLLRKMIISPRSFEIFGILWTWGPGPMALLTVPLIGPVDQYCDSHCAVLWLALETPDTSVAPQKTCAAFTILHALLPLSSTHYGYKSTQGMPCCMGSNYEEGGSMFLQNTGIKCEEYMVQDPRRQPFKLMNDL